MVLDAKALTWALYLLSRSPMWEDRVMDEIASAVPAGAVAAASIEALPTVLQVVKETLRLYPPTWSLFPREALAEVEVGGYVLPKGSWVSILPWVLHRDPRCPGPARIRGRAAVAAKVARIAVRHHTSSNRTFCAPFHSTVRPISGRLSRLEVSVMK